MSHYEQNLGAREIFEGKVIDVKLHTVKLEDGSDATREVVYHNGGVCVAALDTSGCVLLVRQYRFAVGRELLELPAGKLEKGEEPLSAALRELEEETGYTTPQLKTLTKLIPTPGYCSEVIHLYYTTELVVGTQHLDDEEFLTVEHLPLAQAVERVMSGEITDAKTQVGILMLNGIVNGVKKP